MGQTTATPCSFSPAGGSYAVAQFITLSSNPGTVMFYTTDGSTPTMTSQEYVGPILVSANSTVKCIAAVVGFRRDNAQTNNPSSPGTFWKIAQCASFPGWSPTAAYPVGAHVSQGGFNWSAITTNTNKTPSSNPAVWTKYSNCAADNPGGSGVASAISHLSGITSPSLSSSSMLFSGTSEPGKQTNFLFPPQSPFGSCNLCTHFLEVHDYYWPAPNNASSKEDDSFNFDPADGIRLMAGLQYCFGSGCPGGAAGWDYGGNSNVPWTNMGVTAGATFNTWHSFKKLFHAVRSEFISKPCSASGNWPYIYFDALVIDSTEFGPWKYCANALPAGWSNLAGPQEQDDIASHGVATKSTTYWDNLTFIATYDPSSPTSATYTFGPGGVPPLKLNGTITLRGTITVQ